MTKSILTSQDLRTPVLRRSLRKPYPAAVRGEGVYVWDADGKRYLDFSGSAANAGRRAAMVNQYLS